jgi:integrase
LKAKHLNEKELRQLRNAAGVAAWLPFAVAIYTGLRIDDVLALRVENVREEHVLYVAKKTGKVGVAELPRHVARQLQLWARDGWCFPGRGKQKHLTRQAAWYRIKRAAKAAGLDPAGISPHSLRKVFAVGEYQATHNLNRVRALLQHDRAETTLLYALADQLDDIDQPCAPPEDRAAGVG